MNFLSLVFRTYHKYVNVRVMLCSIKTSLCCRIMSVIQRWSKRPNLNVEWITGSHRVVVLFRYRNNGTHFRPSQKRHWYCQLLAWNGTDRATGSSNPGSPLSSSGCECQIVFREEMVGHSSSDHMLDRRGRRGLWRYLTIQQALLKKQTGTCSVS